MSCYMSSGIVIPCLTLLSVPCLEASLLQGASTFTLFLRLGRDVVPLAHRAAVAGVVHVVELDLDDPVHDDAVGVGEARLRQDAVGAALPGDVVASAAAGVVTVVAAASVAAQFRREQGAARQRVQHRVDPARRREERAGEQVVLVRHGVVRHGSHTSRTVVTSRLVGG